MIVVDNLIKRFTDSGRGEVTAVAGLSFTVSAGEVYGLLGPNGAGKTTTLRMLSTLIQPDEGTLTVDGVDARHDPIGIRQRLAYVPAESGLPERLTAHEVVRMFADIQGVADPGAAASRLLDQLGAATYADTRCGALSTGMKRRVVLARALVHEPRALLLDEPTDGLDVQGRREVLELVRQQAASGRAVVISSHIMAEVQRVADRIGVMARGTMVAEGGLKDILAAAGADNLDDAFIALTRDPAA